jgi:hypothetical protein
MHVKHADVEEISITIHYVLKSAIEGYTTAHLFQRDLWCIIYSIVGGCESQCSGFWTFILTHFNAII